MYIAIKWSVFLVPPRTNTEATYCYTTLNNKAVSNQLEISM